MPKRIDRTGEILGKYKILYKDGVSKDDDITYTVQCMKCGFIKHNQVYCILKRSANGKTCRHNDNTLKLTRKATWYSKRLRGIYTGMLCRCNNPKHHTYPNYGGRGIKVCDEWETNPQSFNDWAVENGYDDTLTIDRIDNYDGYKPSNCRWITREENSSHHRAAKLVTVNGITHTLPQWCAVIGLEEHRLTTMYKRKGESAVIKLISDYLNKGIEPKSTKRINITVDGVTKTAAKWSKYLGVEKGYIQQYYYLNGKIATVQRIKEIMTDPSSYKYIKHNKRNITIDGVTKHITEWCDELGLSREAVISRYKRNKHRAIDYITKAKHDAENNKPLVIKLGGLKIGLD